MVEETKVRVRIEVTKIRWPIKYLAVRETWNKLIYGLSFETDIDDDKMTSGEILVSTLRTLALERISELTSCTPLDFVLNFDTVEEPTYD